MRKRAAANARITTPYTTTTPGDNTPDQTSLQAAAERSKFDNRLPQAQPTATTPAQTVNKTVYIGGSQTAEQIPGPVGATGPPGPQGIPGTPASTTIRRIMANYTALPGDRWILASPGSGEVVPDGPS